MRHHRISIQDYIRLAIADANSRRDGNRLIHFIEDAWPIVEPGTEFVRGPHLEAITDHLEAVTCGFIRNLLINMPPRHMKSLAVCVFWPVWEWITTPERRWLFASYAQSLSTRDSLRCRRLIESSWFQQRFGDRFQLCGDQNAKDRFENDKGGCRLAVSTGGAVTGEGGDRIVVDDPHNVIDRQSDAARRAALEWWDQSMSTRLNDPKTGAKVIVMQRLHEKDLSGHVLARGGYEHLCLPAEYESSRGYVTMIGQDWRTREGELLWPERMGEPEISNLKKCLGPDAYAGQFQQRPAPADGAIFRQEWFRYYSRTEDTNRTEDCGLRTEWKDKDHAVGSASADAEIHQPSNTASAKADPTRTWQHTDKDNGEDADTRRSSSSLSPQSSVLSPTYVLHRESLPNEVIARKDCRRFAVMDPAGTEPSVGNNPCYTVIQVWDLMPRHEMLLVHQYRRQVQAPDAADAAIRIARQFNCDFIGIEKDGLGLGVVQTVKRAGVTVRPIKAHGSKEARAQVAQIRMHNGQIFFPREAPYLFDLESELLQFPRSEHADQVDALSHAASLVQRLGASTEEKNTTEARSYGGALIEGEPFHDDEW